MNRTKATFFKFFIFKYPDSTSIPPPKKRIPTPHGSPPPQLINMSYKVPTYYAKGNFRLGSKDQWIQAIFSVERFKSVPKAFRRGSKIKKWQIEAKATWHRFGRETQLVQTKK
jgi:hypothetical protein